MLGEGRRRLQVRAGTSWRQRRLSSLYAWLGWPVSERMKIAGGFMHATPMLWQTLIEPMEGVGFCIAEQHDGLNTSRVE